MLKYTYALFLMSVCCTFCKGQNITDLQTDTITSEPKEAITSYGPNSITRNIIQDRKGNIWIASFKGVFRYDGKSLTDVTGKVSSARFFSILEDRNGNLWFGSIGSGVYYYDGESFRNFTTRDGLLNNEIGCIYEDKIGNIWFGANGGASCFDGKSFRNYMINGSTMVEDRTGKTFPDFTRPPNEVTSIVEDKTGRVWLGTRGNTFVYDGDTFAIVTHDGIPFNNVRTIIKDKNGNIWLGGASGLWRYDGSTFAKFTGNFVGYVYEDRKGNIWTSSEAREANYLLPAAPGWILSRYDEKSLSDKKPTATEFNPREGKMIFGILEANDGSIWFGADGAHRYDGNAVMGFRR